MTHYDRLRRKRLGDVLVDEGFVSGETVIAALREQQRTGALLSDILMESREITDYDLARAIVEHYQAPFIDLQGYTLHKDLIACFPGALLHQARVLPLDHFGDQVCFVCQEVPSEEVAAMLGEQATGGMFFCVASAHEIRERLAEYVPIDTEEDAEPAPGAALIPSGKLEEDAAWKGLFDDANDSILHEIEEVEGE